MKLFKKHKILENFNPDDQILYGRKIKESYIQEWIDKEAIDKINQKFPAGWIIRCHMNRCVISLMATYPKQERQIFTTSFFVEKDSLEQTTQKLVKDYTEKLDKEQRRRQQEQKVADRLEKYFEKG